MKTIAEFYAHTKTNNDCMEWKGAIDRKGYGVVNWKGKNKRTHRLSFELNFGEIPKGLLICHSCDNPLCINPKHLWAGTAKDNTQDMVKKNRGNLKKGVRFKYAPFRPNSKLTEDNVREIRKRIKLGETMVSLSKEFNVSDRTINDINSGYIWGSLESEEERRERIEIVKKFKSERTILRMRKLNLEQIKEIKLRLFKGENQRLIAKDYNVSQCTIADINKGKRWKEI